MTSGDAVPHLSHCARDVTKPCCVVGRLAMIGSRSWIVLWTSCRASLQMTRLMTAVGASLSFGLCARTGFCVLLCVCARRRLGCLFVSVIASAVKNRPAWFHVH